MRVHWAAMLCVLALDSVGRRLGFVNKSCRQRAPAAEDNKLSSLHLCVCVSPAPRSCIVPRFIFTQSALCGDDVSASGSLSFASLWYSFISKKGTDKTNKWKCIFVFARESSNLFLSALKGWRLFAFILNKTRTGLIGVSPGSNKKNTHTGSLVRLCLFIEGWIYSAAGEPHWNNRRGL